MDEIRPPRGIGQTVALGNAEPQLGKIIEQIRPARAWRSRKLLNICKINFPKTWAMYPTP